MIERDGFPFIFGSLFLALLFWGAGLVFDIPWTWVSAAIFGLFGVFCAFFFRSPKRSPQGSDADVISPADGLTLKVDTLDSYPGFSRSVKRISIFLSVFDVHVNWTPIAGEVTHVQYQPGAFRLAHVDKASDDNEHTEIGINSDYGPVVFKQIAGMIARRIVCRLSQGDFVARGEKFGMIKFGSRIDLFVPADSEILVEPRQRVRGGETVLARLRTTASMRSQDADVSHQESDSAHGR